MSKQADQALAAASLAACVLLLSISNPAIAAAVQFDADCAPMLTGFDRTLYYKAGEGIVPLRRYMDVRRVILQRDIRDTAVWAAGVAEERKRCVSSTRASQDYAPVAAVR